MNSDGGAYSLPTTYARILVTCYRQCHVTISLISSPLANKTLQLGTVFASGYVI